MNNEAVTAAADALDGDVFLYNGPIQRVADLTAMQRIKNARCSRIATLVLVTGGGDPDAAFKLARYFQEKYDYFRVIVSGLCKSAGTLLALGANELVFAPYGELGPLDVQLTKVDDFGRMESGLVISDSLTTIEERALKLYYDTTRALLEGNQGMISFATASQSAMEISRAIYAPVMARIDPEEIGIRSRAMRIAQDYGDRLALRSQNLKPNTLFLLSDSYPSHSFVIDRVEAETLFHRVREADDHEMILVETLERAARFPDRNVRFEPLHTPTPAVPEEANDDQADRTGSATTHGGDPGEAVAAPVAAPTSGRSRLRGDAAAGD